MQQAIEHSSSNSELSWSRYAETYDMLLQYNPFYQELYRDVLSHVENWDLSPSSKVIDVGAGTGNYSITIAALFPQAQMIHVDSDARMIAQAKRKAHNLNAHVEFVESDVSQLDVEAESLAGCISIHALYTFPDPIGTLVKLRSWMRSGAPFVFVDPGRVVNVLDWQWAIGIRMISKYGLRKTLKVMQEGKEVSKQNKLISRKQARGEFWLHSHEGFVKAVEAAGFKVEGAKTTFRGISDMVWGTTG